MEEPFWSSCFHYFLLPNLEDRCRPFLIALKRAPTISLLEKSSKLREKNSWKRKNEKDRRKLWGRGVKVGRCWSSKLYQARVNFTDPFCAKHRCAGTWHLAYGVTKFHNKITPNSSCFGAVIILRYEKSASSKVKKGPYLPYICPYWKKSVSNLCSRVCFACRSWNVSTKTSSLVFFTVRHKQSTVVVRHLWIRLFLCACVCACVCERENWKYQQ